MNLVDAYVTKVLSDPEFIDQYKDEGITWWQIRVECNSYGRIDETTLSFKTKEEAESVAVGHKFLT